MAKGVSLTTREQELILKYRGFYDDLASGKRPPNTAAQRHFVAVVKGTAQPQTEHEHAFLKSRRLAKSGLPKKIKKRDAISAERVSKKGGAGPPRRLPKKRSGVRKIRIAGDTLKVRDQIPDYCLVRSLYDLGARVHAEELALRKWKVGIEAVDTRFEGEAASHVRALWIAFDAAVRHVRHGQMKGDFAEGILRILEVSGDPKRAKVFVRGVAERVFAEELSRRAAKFRDQEKYILPRGVVWDRVCAPLVSRFRSVLPLDAMEEMFASELKRSIVAVARPTLVSGTEVERDNLDPKGSTAPWIGGERAYREAMRGTARDFHARKNEDYQ
jgi:uncharacterized protein YifE (UPF0438 family)